MRIACICIGAPLVHAYVWGMWVVCVCIHTIRAHTLTYNVQRTHSVHTGYSQRTHRAMGGSATKRRETAR